MPWKDNTGHIKSRSRFHCDVCDLIFEIRHEGALEVVPDCPACLVAGRDGGGSNWLAPMPAIGTTKGKAIDLAQKIAEEDYGLTDMNDNQRAGDIAFKGPAPMQGAEADRLIREMVEYQRQTGPAAPLPSGPLAPDGSRQVLVDPALQKENFWQGSQGGSAETTVGQQAAAKAASDAARAQGVDPVGILERGRQSGNMPFKVVPVAVEPSSDLPQALQAGQAKTQANPQAMPRAV